MGDVGVDALLHLPEAPQQPGIGEGGQQAPLVDRRRQRPHDGQRQGGVPLLIVRVEQRFRGGVERVDQQRSLELRHVRLGDLDERRAGGGAHLAHDFQVGRIAVAGEEGDAGAGDAGLVQHALPLLLAEHVGVVGADVGEGSRHGVEGTCLVVAAAHAGLQGGPFHTVPVKRVSAMRIDTSWKVGPVGLVGREVDGVRPDLLFPGGGDVGRLTNSPPMLKRSR